MYILVALFVQDVLNTLEVVDEDVVDEFEIVMRCDAPVEEAEEEEDKAAADESFAVKEVVEPFVENELMELVDVEVAAVVVDNMDTDNHEDMNNKDIAGV